jgi:hypothetical protein|tara:strand:+ start:690 stop:932 length:243 start_codon:yes stop_codon:yes gene_type:complete
MKTIEFISERKVVKTMHRFDEAIKLVHNLRNARTKDQSTLEAIWKNVAKFLEVDPFLKLSIRVKENNKIVAKSTVWNSTL